MKINKSWLSSMLGSVCVIHDGDRIPINSRERKRRKAKCKELYPYYGATGQVDSIDGYIFDGEYVLLGEDGAPFLDLFRNKAYLVHGKFWVNNHAHILTGFSNILDNNFLCYYLNQFNYSEFVTGTTRLKLTQARLKNIPICLPPFSEQRRIVAKIESLFSRLDSAKDSLERTRKEIKRYRQSVFKAAFIGKLTPGINLREVSFSEVIEKDLGGGTPSKSKSEYWEGNIPWASVKDMNSEGKYLESTVDRITKKAIESSSTNLIPAGNIIVCTRISVGKILINKIAVAINQDLRAFFLKEEIDRNYFLYYYRTVKFKTSGTTVKGIRKDDLLQYPFPVCSTEEQSQIVQTIESRFEKAKVLEDAIEQGLTKIEQLKQSILKKAFEGRLVEPDPNDEPVEVSLERIKKEKGKKFKVGLGGRDG